MVKKCMDDQVEVEVVDVVSEEFISNRGDQWTSSDLYGVNLSRVQAILPLKGQLSIDGNGDNIRLVAQHQVKVGAKHKGERSLKVELLIGGPFTLLHAVAHNHLLIRSNAHVKGYGLLGCL